MKELNIDAIKEELLKLGVSPQLRAFEWLARAIQICSQDKAIRDNPMGQLYNQLAQDYNLESDHILQAIRRAVRFSWIGRNDTEQSKETYNTVFGYRQERDKAPSSLEFITRVSDYLSKEESI